LFDTEHNAEIFDDTFLNKYNLFNDIHPLLKDLTTLMPPPIHHPSTLTVSTPALQDAAGTSQPATRRNNNKPRAPGGIAATRKLAYKLPPH
jgi:hypothetical protein